MNVNTDSIKTYTWVIGLITVFYLLSFPSIWNQNVNCTIAERGIQNVGGLDIYDSSPLEVLFKGAIFPPIYIYIFTKISIAAGYNWALTLLFTNFIFLAILVIFQFFLAKMFTDNTTAAISVILVLLYPLTFLGFNTLSIEFSLMGMMAAVIFLFFKTLSFERTGWSVLLAVACGIGMMIKQPFGAYLLGIFAIGAFYVLKSVLQKKFMPLVNYFIFCAIFTIVIAPFYIMPHLHGGGAASLKTGFVENIITTILNVEPDISTKRILFQGLWESQLTPPFFLLLLAGIYYFMRDANVSIKVILISSILIPNIILYLMPHFVAPRYLMPCMPVYAVISAYALKKSLNYKIFKYSIFAFVLVGLVQLFGFVYAGSGWLNAGFKGLEYWRGSVDLNPNYKNREAQGIVLKKMNDGLKPYLKEYSRLKAIPEKEKYSLLFLIDNSINDADIANTHCSMCYYPSFNKMNYRINCAVLSGLMEYIYQGKNDLATLIEQTDFILYTTTSMPAASEMISFKNTLNDNLISKDQGPYSECVTRWKRYLRAFRRSGTFVAKEGTISVVYEKKISPAKKLR